MKIKLGGIFKGIAKAIGGIAKSLFKGKLFGILGGLLKFIPGLNLAGIVGNALKVLGSAQKFQQFLQVGRQVFEALRGKHRIDDRVQTLPAPAYPPAHRGSTSPPSGHAVRLDPAEIRRIIDEIRRRLEDLRPWLRPLPAPVPSPPPGWNPDPGFRLPDEPPGWIVPLVQRFQDNPVVAPYLPFPPPAAAAFIGQTLQDFATELNRLFGGAPPSAEPQVIIR